MFIGGSYEKNVARDVAHGRSGYSVSNLSLFEEKWKVYLSASGFLRVLLHSLVLPLQLLS
jgi:hypothetical protein